MTSSRTMRTLLLFLGFLIVSELQTFAQDEPVLSKRLKGSVTKLAAEIGERNLVRYEQLCEAADWIQSELKEYGYAVSRQTFELDRKECHNIVAEKVGAKQPKEVLIVGAHYDSVFGAPGANDNGSGTASMLALAELLKDTSFDRTVRFVAFTNEEPPYFQRAGKMGSLVYARQCRKNNENIVGVLSLETMGYFSNKPNSQKYPPPLDQHYPSTGNFIGFVSNIPSRPFLRQCVKAFKQSCDVPCEQASLPSLIPGVGWSDHWSFWQEGYVGVMVTDTAPFRYPHYHKRTDTVDKIDFETLAKVNLGLAEVIRELGKATQK